MRQSCFVALALTTTHKIKTTYKLKCEQSTHKKQSYAKLTMSGFKVSKIKIPTSSTTDYNPFDFASSPHNHDTLYAYKVYDTPILGRGTFGVVAKCANRLTGIEFAVKTIDKHKLKVHMNGGKLDFKQEIKILNGVNHPNVLSIIDYIEDHHYLHIITELYTGGDLCDYIINNTPSHGIGCLSEVDARSIIIALLETILYLHSKNIVHRDVKPENILFSCQPCNHSDKGSLIKLIDFGFAKHHGLHDQRMRTKIGTAFYMAPEILKGSYDRSVDLWATGVICFIMLCGYPPFDGDNEYEINSATKKGTIVFDDEVWDKLSVDSKLFVKRLLSSDSDRLEDAATALDCHWLGNST